MTIQSPPPSSTTLIPENAPFSTEQRAWLNGFFAGMLALDAGPAPAPTADLGAAGVAGDDGTSPWRDPALEIDDRMQLAEGRPLNRRMMAAMAQQDCGQ